MICLLFIIMWVCWTSLENIPNMKFEVSGFYGKSILYCILSYTCTCARIDYKEYDIDKRVFFQWNRTEQEGDLW